MKFHIDPVPPVNWVRAGSMGAHRVAHRVAHGDFGAAISRADCLFAFGWSLLTRSLAGSPSVSLAAHTNSGAPSGASKLAGRLGHRRPITSHMIRAQADGAQDGHAS